MAAAAHKLAISFGLVHIPINLHKAISVDRVGFNQIHAPTGKRVRQKKVVEGTDIEVESSDIVKGYEVDKGQYITFTDTEIDNLRSEKDKTITIDRFVPMGSVDPIYYDESYYVEPNGSDKAYSLLNAAMMRENCIGIGKAVLGTREKLFALTPMESGIAVQTLHFDAQVRAAPMARLAPVDEASLEMGRMLVKALKASFEPMAYRDESEEKIKAAIQAKVNNQEIRTPEDQPGNIIDLQEMLQHSLAMTKDQKPDLAGIK